MGKFNPVKTVTNAVSSVVKGATDVVKGVVQPVYNATLKQIPGVDKALVGLDKSVGKAIPGGWGTVASVAASFIPGAAFLPGGTLGSLGITKTGLATGLGALSGSGVMRKGHEFNLQGAILGGAMAYGASQVAEGLQAAGSGSAVEAAEKALASDTARIAANLGVEGAGTGAGSQAAMLANQTAGLEAIPRGLADAIPKGAALEAANSGLANADVFSGLAGTQGAVPQAIVPQPSGLANLAQTGQETLSSIGQAGKGIANLTGFGDTSISNAYSAFKAPITQTGLAAGVIGTSGMMALEEQRKMLDQQLAQGTIAQEEYNEAVASINRQVEFAKQTVAENPFKTDTDVSGSLSGSRQDSPEVYKTLYDRTPSSPQTLYNKEPVARYAYGGVVNPADDQTSMENQSPMTNINMQSLGGLFKGLGLGNLQQAQPAVLNSDQYTRYGEARAQQPSSSSPQSAFNDEMPSSPFGMGLGSTGGNSQNAFPLQGQYGIVKMAAGGMPRFLSGGGDGMSDSIRANINGTQEARLADGEFVIPADVVSHLGNGSSKAGAKQLYAMMDKVRQARTGRKSQGKQINPRKYLLA